MTTTKRHFQPAANRWMAVLMLVAAVVFLPATSYAQECFVYGDDDPTTITGLTEYGSSQYELTIPANVTSVDGYAFSFLRADSLSLYILGNTAFQDDSFCGVEDKVRFIDFGSNMSVDNMKQLVVCLGEGNQLRKLEITGYTGDGNFTWGEEDRVYLSSNVRVTMPAALVDEQVFGYAAVYGRFDLLNPLSTFCSKQSFYDVDDNANFLFYRAKELATDPNDGIKKLHIVREHCIVGGQGVVGLSSGSTKDASLGQANENGTFSGDEASNNSAIWEEWN